VEKWRRRGSQERRGKQVGGSGGGRKKIERLKQKQNQERVGEAVANAVAIGTEALGPSQSSRSR
jgi:hypothetical protein